MGACVATLWHAQAERWHISAVRALVAMASGARQVTLMMRMAALAAKSWQCERGAKAKLAADAAAEG